MNTKHKQKTQNIPTNMRALALYIAILPLEARALKRSVNNNCERIRITSTQKDSEKY